jgi:hypothetical protein
MGKMVGNFTKSQPPRYKPFFNRVKRGSARIGTARLRRFGGEMCIFCQWNWILLFLLGTFSFSGKSMVDTGGTVE